MTFRKWLAIGAIRLAELLSGDSILYNCDDCLRMPFTMRLKNFVDDVEFRSAPDIVFRGVVI
jgi:uncharacterized protein (DUF1499 family)